MDCNCPRPLGIAPRSIRFEQELRKLGQAITGKSDTQSNEFEDD